MNTKLYNYVLRADVKEYSAWKMVNIRSDPLLLRLYKVYLYSDKYVMYIPAGEAFTSWANKAQPFELEIEFNSHEIAELFLEEI